jgi:uncharacterized membrane protein
MRWRSGRWATILAVLLYSPSALADDTVERAVKIILTLCVDGGSVKISKSTSTPSGGEYRLESDKGSFTIESREAQGLIDGISSNLTALSAQQADRARACMSPYISQVLAILNGSKSDQTMEQHREPPVPQQQQQINFRFDICNFSGSREMWVAVGLPTYQSDHEPIIRGWWMIPQGRCESWPGYYLPGNRQLAYFHAETFPSPGHVVTHAPDGGPPVMFCIGEDHQNYNRVNTPGYKCGNNERSLDFWKVQLQSGETKISIRGP